MTRILLLGATGQVGWELNRSLQPLGEVLAPPRIEADFSQPETLRGVVRASGAEIIVNAAAYTAVDKAESEESIAYAVNATAPTVLAQEAERLGSLLVHYSTDYVFDGEGAEPYVEGDMPHPINAYGRTKLAGDQGIQSAGCRHLIFRTSWVYASRGQNFVKTILRLAEQRDELKIVDDQIGAPTSARLIADVTGNILAKMHSGSTRSNDDLCGTYNLTSSGSASWYGFAKTILAARNVGSSAGENNPVLIPIPAKDYPLPAQRPKNSRLNCDKLIARFGINLPHWETSARLCLEEIVGPRQSQ
jgi:dTDP-4-dehydrorhamnose reductase